MFRDARVSFAGLTGDFSICHKKGVLIASRRVGEVFNIYAPDKETVVYLK